MQILILTILQFSGSETFLPWQAFASIEKSEKLWNRFLHIVSPFIFWCITRYVKNYYSKRNFDYQVYISVCIYYSFDRRLKELKED